MQPVEFWFDFGSIYSYPAAMRVEQVAAAAGVDLVWRPFLLAPVLLEQIGLKEHPLVGQDAKTRYVWRDIERVCADLELSFQKPALFPQNVLKATRLATLGREAPWLVSFVKDVFAANYAEMRDVASDVVLAELLTRIGLDAGATLREARSSEVKAKLKASCDEAREKGLFGAPSIVVEGPDGPEIFWGNDRLDQAFAFASKMAASKALPASLAG